jgi:hypothetical protein
MSMKKGLPSSISISPVKFEVFLSLCYLCHTSNKSNTPSVPKYFMFDFFDINFEHLSYSKYFKNMKKSNIYLKHIIFKIKNNSDFFIIRVVKLMCKKSDWLIQQCT